MAAKTMDEYTGSLNADGQRYVQDFADFMAAACPQLRARMSYGMPMWLAGARLREGYVAISAATRHFSIHFDNEAVVRELSRELPACRAGKRCINIGYDDDASYAAVKAVVAGLFPG